MPQNEMNLYDGMNLQFSKTYYPGGHQFPSTGGGGGGGGGEGEGGEGG